MSEEQVIALLQMHAVQVSLLAEIRDMMRACLASAGASPEGEFATCQHPEQSRVDLSTPGDRNHWVCSECRFDSKSVA